MTTVKRSRGQPRNHERIASVIRLRREGLSFNQMARVLGITPQRCHEIWKNYGDKTTPPSGN